MHNTMNPPPPHARGAAFYFPSASRKCEFVAHIETRRPRRRCSSSSSSSLSLFLSLRVSQREDAAICHHAETQLNAMRSAFLCYFLVFDFIFSSLLLALRRFRPSVLTSCGPLIFETRLRRRGPMERKADARVYRRQKFIMRRRLISSACPPPSCIFIKSSLRVAR